MIDLDHAERVINRPHIVDLRDDGFTLMHPPACHPRLFDCEYNVIARNNFRDPGKRGHYECALYRGADDDDPVFTIGEPAGDIEGVDWTALVAELRVTRRVAEAADRVLNGRAVQSELRAALTAWHEHHGTVR